MLTGSKWQGCLPLASACLYANYANSSTFQFNGNDICFHKMYHGPNNLNNLTWYRSSQDLIQRPFYATQCFVMYPNRAIVYIFISYFHLPSPVLSLSAHRVSDMTRFVNGALTKKMPVTRFFSLSPASQPSPSFPFLSTLHPPLQRSLSVSSLLKLTLSRLFLSFQPGGKLKYDKHTPMEEH